MLIRLTVALLFVCGVTPSYAQKNMPDSDWPDYGGTLAGQRYSSQALITPKNVNQLRPAWVFHTHTFDKQSTTSNPRASSEATPVLWKGKLYFDTPFDEIFAVDPETGEKIWSFDPQVDREAAIYIVTSRGVALWHARKPGKGICESDRVFVATLDRRLIARDAKTGLACNGFGQSGTVDLSQGVDVAVSRLYEFTSPPTVVGDTVVLGSTVGDNQYTYAASGAVRGFDAITGQQKWIWEPLPDSDRRAIGSANAWSVISADPENDLLFVPTGSASVDFYGGTRPGDNRDADSIVALRASTGKRVWGFQLVHHDIWDYDTPSEPLLFTFRGKIPAVAVTTKTGMVYVFNRLTGEPIYPINEKPVPQSTLRGEKTWPTQPFSSLPPLVPLSFTAADIHLHNKEDQAACVNEIKKLDNRGIFTPPSAKGSLVYPGSIGGANWGSSSFDPESGTLYTRVSNLPFFVRQLPGGYGRDLVSRVEFKLRKTLPEWAGGDPVPDNNFRTPDSGSNPRESSQQEGTPYRLYRGALITHSGTICGPGPFGALVAINLNTGVKLWSVPHGEMVKGEAGSIGAGGPIVTAGGLIFVASTNDPYIRAYDSASGLELWRGALPVPSNANPMTYAIHGRQYVVQVAGGHGFITAGQSDQVIAFALPTAPKTMKGIKHP